MPVVWVADFRSAISDILTKLPTYILDLAGELEDIICGTAGTMLFAKSQEENRGKREHF